MFNPIITKVGLGSATIIGTGVTGYCYREKIINWFSNEKEIFLIAKNGNSNVDTSLNDKKLYEENAKKEIIKNFKCQIGKNVDEKCDIFSLSEANGKLIDLLEIKKFKNKGTNAELKTNNLFVVKIDSNLVKEWKKDKTTTLKILSKSIKKNNSNELATFGEFSLLYKIVDDDVEGQTNIFLTKAQQPNAATPQPTIDTSSSYVCQIKDKKSDCSIYKFTDSLTAKQTYKDLSFDSGKISAPTNFSEIKKDSYYLITLKTDNYDLSELKNNPTVIFVKKTETPPAEQEIGKFTHVSSMYNKDSTFTAGTSKPIFLS